MENVVPKSWLLVLMAGFVIPATCGSRCAAQSPSSITQRTRQVAARNKPSMVESVVSSVKGGVSKFTQAVTPKPSVKPADDPVSLSSTGRPSAQLYVAIARTYEQSGNLGRASEHYQKALQHTPNYLGALLGYARLKDRLGQPEEASGLYQQAVKSYPDEASVYNNMALFYAKRGMLDESAAALKSAIRLQPRQAKYRNNIAPVLVEMGQLREAFAHLRTVHSEAAAYYNLGFLLELKQDLQAAKRHYAMALRKDPSLVQAKAAIQRLETPPRQARVPQPRPRLQPNRPAAEPLPPRSTTPQVPLDRGPRAAVRQLPPAPRQSRYGSGLPNIRVRGTRPNGTAPLPHGSSIPKRLPPTSPGRKIAPKPAPLPPGTLKRRPTPVAPLPPSTTHGPPVQPLPPVD